MKGTLWSHLVKSQPSSGQRCSWAMRKTGSPGALRRKTREEEPSPLLTAAQSSPAAPWTTKEVALRPLLSWRHLMSLSISPSSTTCPPRSAYKSTRPSQLPPSASQTDGGLAKGGRRGPFAGEGDDAEAVVGAEDGGSGGAGPEGQPALVQGGTALFPERREALAERQALGMAS